MSHFINGQWEEGGDGHFSAVDPAHDKIIWQGTAADPFTVKRSVQAAKEAFPKWSDLEFQERANYLLKFRDILLNSKSSLAKAISQSVGKPLWESESEVTAMANKVSISIEAFQTRCPTTQNELSQNLSTTTHRPHGVMAVLGPFNFPGHLPNGHVIPALLAGNTVVLKPSELAPLAAEAIIKCWEACHLPRGVLNMIQGGRESGRSLVENPEIEGLLFTGSWSAGKHLAEFMAKTPYKILALEMGGNNPLVIGSLMDFEAAAYLTIQSAFLTSGQRCTCARRLIVQTGTQGDQFLQCLIERMKAIRVGAYEESPEPFMGPVISKEAAAHLLDAQKKLMNAGAAPLVKMSGMKQSAAFLTPGLIDVTALAARPDEEYFGPFLQVIRTKNFEASMEEANRTRYGLASGLLSESEEEFKLFFKRARAGVINWNTPLTGASSAAPFGGIGQSGNHRPTALYAADYCSYPVASMQSKKMQVVSSPGLL